MTVRQLLVSSQSAAVLVLCVQFCRTRGCCRPVVGVVGALSFCCYARCAVWHPTNVRRDSRHSISVLPPSVGRALYASITCTGTAILAPRALRATASVAWASARMLPIIRASCVVTSCCTSSCDFFFFLTDPRSSKSTQDCAWESGRLQHMIQWIPRNAGHMAKTQCSHVYTRGLSCAVGKPRLHKANL